MKNKTGLKIGDVIHITEESTYNNVKTDYYVINKIKFEPATRTNHIVAIFFYNKYENSDSAINIQNEVKENWETTLKRLVRKATQKEAERFYLMRFVDA